MKRYVHRERKFHQHPRIRIRKFPKWNVAEEPSVNNQGYTRELTEIDDS